jgi:hypothetical protein
MEEVKAQKEPIKIEIPERMKQKLQDLNSHIMIMQKQFNDLLDTLFELKGVDPKGKVVQMEQDFSKVTLVEEPKK